MYQASDPVTLYLNLLSREFALDRWSRRRVLAEIEDHLREAEDRRRDRQVRRAFSAITRDWRAN